jgi:hypothetical protein
MQKNILALLSLLLLLFNSACKVYHPDSLAAHRFSSPPIKWTPQIFYPSQNLPQQDYMQLDEEYLNTSEPGPQALFRELSARNLDGAIVYHQDYSSHEATEEIQPGLLSYVIAAAVSSDAPEPTYHTYTAHDYYIQYRPFIYLHRLEEREFLDQVEITITSPSGESQSEILEFDWWGQIQFFPPEFDSSAFSQALFIQPWFFLEQHNSSWSWANSNNHILPHRRYISGNWHLNYRAPFEGLSYRLRVEGPNYNILLKANESGRFRLSALEIKGQIIPVKEIEFLSILKKQELQLPDGTKIGYRYFYKKRSMVPQDWIVRTKDLQH